METARRFIAEAPTRFAAYLALQSALMQRFVARGGTPEEFCARLAPVFHRRYAPLLLDPEGRCRGLCPRCARRPARPGAPALHSSRYTWSTASSAPCCRAQCAPQ